MNYKTFGRRTGLRVSELALGTGNFGTGWGHGATREEARKIFEAYLHAGGNFIDSADSYQRGESETMLGEFIAAERDNLVVATKYTMGTEPKGGSGLSRTGNSRKNMIASVDASLRRLRSDRVDLLWVHLDDGMTPLDEILRGFDDLVRSGKILHAGFSNFPAWRISRAALLADTNAWAPVAGIQLEYSLVERTGDRELLPMAESLGLAATCWSPLGGGFLTGKYRSEADANSRLNSLKVLIHTEKTDRETAVLDAVLAVAKETQASPTQVAIAWLLAKGRAASTTLVPILGSRTAEQLAATLGALRLELSLDQIATLSAAGAVPLGVPHEMMRNSANALAGGDAARLTRPGPPVP